MIQLIFKIVTAAVFIHMVYSQPGYIAGSPLSGCLQGFAAFGSSCYKAFSVKANWIQAKSYCQAFRSELLIIETPKEEESIKEYLSHVTTHSPSKTYWIDGSDLLAESDWIWARTNTQIQYKDWDYADGNPNNSGGNENCMELMFLVNSTWNDKSCETPNEFICEAEIQL